MCITVMVGKMIFALFYGKLQRFPLATKIELTSIITFSYLKPLSDIEISLCIMKLKYHLR